MAKANDPSPCLAALRALGYRGDEPVMGITDCFKMTSRDGNSVKIKIHKRSRLRGDRYQYWYGINDGCLSRVDFIALWHENGPRLPLVPTSFLKKVYKKMVDASKSGVGGPKVEDGRWHVDVTFKPGGQVVLRPTNWVGGEPPDITAFCETILSG